MKDSKKEKETLYIHSVAKLQSNKIATKAQRHKEKFKFILMIIGALVSLWRIFMQKKQEFKQ